MPRLFKMAVSVPDLQDAMDVIMRPMDKVMREELDKAEELFDKTYTIWSPQSKPKWARTNKIEADGFSRTLLTTSTPFVFVSVPRRHGRVTFTKDYRAMTVPRKLHSTPRRGKAIGGIGNRIKPVPREFEFAVAQRRQGFFTRRAQTALNKGVGNLIGRRRRGARF